MTKKVLVILGGNSPKNKEWVIDMSSYFGSIYTTVEIIYSSWDSPGSDVNFDKELKTLQKKVNTYKEYSIIAKSAGLLVALIGIKAMVLKPDKVIALGVPVKYSLHIGLDITQLIENSLLKREQFLVIQQKNDPQGSAALIHKTYADKVEMVTISGRDHYYGKFEQFDQYIYSFLS